MWHGTHPYWLDGLHKKYGHVVRVSPSELSYTDGQAWKDIYGHTRDGKRGCAKEPRFYGPVKDLDNGTPGILEADDVNHTRFRKIFSHAFSPKALQEQEPIFQKYTSLLIDKLKEKIGGNSHGEFDLLAWYKCVRSNLWSSIWASLIVVAQLYHVRCDGRPHLWRILEAS